MSLPISEYLGTSVLFYLAPIELPDAVEQSLLHRYYTLTKEWNGKSLNELSTETLRKANASQDGYAEVMHGLLFGILVNPEEKMSVL